MLFTYILVFIISIIILFWSGPKLVKALMRMARFLGWREFVVAFFVMSIAGAVPNLFVGINSALQGIPELSFGDIVGGNLIDLTLAVALAIFIGGVALPAKSKMVQSSAVFTAVVAVLPLLLILDNKLGRIDGIILILAFILYIIWLFSKEERFKKTYNQKKKRKGRFKGFLKDIGRVFFFLAMLLLASKGIVTSAVAFSETLNISLPIVGILIVGAGNALPEIYFAVVSAKRKQNWLILGDLMGSVVVCATLILGIVALISPIIISDFSPFAIAGFFLIVSAVFFFVIVKTDQKISRKEGVVLLLIYLLFLVAEIMLR